jgi:ArsR family transcriptional regulator, zinc-responsive transcriptional repressor
MIAEAAQIYKVFSNPRRLTLINYMMNQPQPVNVSRMCADLQLSQPIVSKQLGVLYRYQVVEKSKQGQQVFYTVNDPHIVEMVHDMLAHVQHEIHGKSHPKTMF